MPRLWITLKPIFQNSLIFINANLSVTQRDSYTQLSNPNLDFYKINLQIVTLLIFTPGYQWAFQLPLGFAAIFFLHQGVNSRTSKIGLVKMILDTAPCGTRNKWLPPQKKAKRYTLTQNSID